MYPFERFTERAKKVLTLSQDEAQRSHHNYIGTEHLLLGLLRENDGLAARVLDNLGVDIGRVRQTIESVLGRSEVIGFQQKIPTSRVKKVIEISFEEAQRMGHNYVGTEHLLLGLMIEGEGIAAHVLADLGVTLASVRQETERLLVSTEADDRKQEQRAYAIGGRVLVHDPEPPYRLWEGTVMKVDEKELEISVPERTAGEVVRADRRLVHRIPMGWTTDCPYCRAV